MRRFGFAALAAFAMGGASAAWADQPVERGIDFQPAATPAMAHIHSFHAFVLPIITVISVFVLALLLWVVIRYNRKANPTPRMFTHNMLVEVIWTIVPVLILVAIAWRSFPLLYEQERAPPAALTIKVVGNSWFWQYEYQDLGVTVASNRLPEEEARAQSRPNLLAVDNPIYVPVGENVSVLITSNDVIHSWTVPAFGVKQDAIPGRVNQGWFNVDRPGIYYGQCSELCGINHAYMPIEVRAVSREEFDRWVVSQGGTLADAAPAAAQPAPAPSAPAAGASPTR
ncbi:MAG: cytochrome c oxidase subunit II [Hyphomonadaceae bacterium]|nr:cytochrome c oxidase subunit II [Hyphomonadaceae bacterium]